MVVWRPSSIVPYLPRLYVPYVPHVVKHYTIPTKKKVPIMADQVTGVAVTVSGATYSVQIGPNRFSGLPVADLFDWVTFNPDHLFGNIRLKHVIGNFGELWSKEFADALNNTGVATTAGDFYNVGFAANQDGSYTLSFGSVLGGVANQTITFNPVDLLEDTHDLNMVLLNLGAFLRRAGYTDLTTPATSGLHAGKTGIQAIAEATFRY
jgi:hypothetical protein